MDYEGQKLAELLFYWIILSFGAVGWVIGYIQQDFFIVFQAWLVGVVISVIVSWPNPVLPHDFDLCSCLITVLPALCSRLALLQQASHKVA